MSWVDILLGSFSLAYMIISSLVLAHWYDTGELFPKKENNDKNNDRRQS